MVIDNIAPEPTVRLLEPLNRHGVFRRMDLRASVTSPVSLPISRVEFRVNGRLVPSTPVAGMPVYETTFDFTRYTGTATITVTAWDMANNMGLDRAVVSIVPPPTFRIADLAAPSGSSLGAGYDVGDVNGDGLLDIVAGGSELSVLTGTITGRRFGFLPGRRIGDATQSVKLAHISLGPALDVVALRGSSFAIYANHGDGVFDPPVVTTTGMPSASDLQIADLNGDQYPDVVVGLDAAGAGDFIVFFNSRGAFSTGTTYGRVGTVTELAIGRLTLANHLDIVVGRSGNSLVSAFLNDGAGHYGAGTDTFANGPTRAVAIGDVTGDGYPDIVAAVPALSEITVLQGDPMTAGRFTVAGLVPTQLGPSGIALADLNGDGSLDAVVSLTTGCGIDVFLNSGTGTFTRRGTYAMTRDALRPKLVNLFGNNRLDAIVTSGVNGEIAFAKSLGNGNFRAAPSTIISQTPVAIASGHLLGPGNRIDLALSVAPSTTPPAPGTVRIFQNTPTGFQPAPTLTLPLLPEITQPGGIAIGDIDGANGLDIAVGSANAASTMTTPTAMLFLSNGSGGFTPVRIVGVDHPQSVAIGDVDNDGVGEAVFTLNRGSLTMDDGSVVVEADGIASAPVLSGHGASSVAIASFNGRTTIDYAVANPGTSDISLNHWNGRGFETTVYSALPGVSAITVGRVARHTINDIVGVSNQFGVVILQGRNGTGFDSPVRYDAGPSPSGVVGGDFNRDGLYDVMVLNPQNDTASLLIASPQGGFFRPISIAMPRNPLGFTVADFDGDGRADLAVASSGAPSVTVVFSNGDLL